MTRGDGPVLRAWGFHRPSRGIHAHIQQRLSTAQGPRALLVSGAFSVQKEKSALT